MVSGRLSPEQSIVTDLDAGAAGGWDNLDVTSLQVKGEALDARILAGAASSGRVYISSDGGTNWRASEKDATGQSQTFILMADDFLSSNRVYAATSGSDSAVSLSLSGGLTWSQIGLIDTAIDALLYLAVSPGYENDGSLFLLSWGGSHSLWRTTDFGVSWRRVFCSALPDVDVLDTVSLSPDYGDGSHVLYLSGGQDGSPGIYKSVDNGDSFIFNDAPLAVDYMLVAGDSELFLAGFNGLSGVVFRTRNSGRSYTSTALGSNPITSMALSPAYKEDGVMLVGNSNGWVYLSDDRGASFETLPSGATAPPLTGNIKVAFDDDFNGNQVVYAASDSPDQGVFRFIVGQDSSWQQLDDTLPDGGMLGGIAISDDGVLYATNFQQVDNPDGKGGVERTLNPSYYYGATFKTITEGLEDGATLWGLWINSRRLWSLDTTGNALMTFYDSLAQPVTLTSPPDQAPGVGTIRNDEVRDIELDWETLPGASSYQWQLSDDGSFSFIPAGFEGVTTSSRVELPDLEIGSTYYWRVRANSPFLSFWSEKWSFTTSLGGDIVAPVLRSPAAGASGVALRPVFQWSAISGAEGYELLLALDSGFTDVVIARLGNLALPGNAWQVEIDLEYEVTYYWKVRAVNSDSHSAWSAIGAFTVKQAPAEVNNPHNSPQEKPPVVAISAANAEQDWVIYVLIALALVVVILLFTILMLVARKK